MDGELNAGAKQHHPCISVFSSTPILDPACFIFLPSEEDERVSERKEEKGREGKERKGGVCVCVFSVDVFVFVCVCVNVAERWNSLMRFLQ